VISRALRASPRAWFVATVVITFIGSVVYFATGNYTGSDRLASGVIFLVVGYSLGREAA
jgi:hypothetical protein